MQKEARGRSIIAGDAKPKARQLARHQLPPDENTTRVEFLNVLKERTKRLEFKRWLDIFFIQKGDYRISDTAYAELGEEIQRITELTQLTNAEIKKRVRIKIAQMLADRGAEELYDKGYIDRPIRLNWEKKEIRIEVIKKFVGCIGKNVRNISAKDFQSYGLGGLLIRRVKEGYNNSPYLALVEAGYGYSIKETLKHARTGKFGIEKIYPWEMKWSPKNYKNKELRKATTKWLLWRVKKNPINLDTDHFRDNDLERFLAGCYKGSSYLALVEAGYAYSIEELLEHARTGKFKTKRIYPWEMTKSPYIYDEKDNRIAATKWLVWKLREIKKPREIIANDFYNNGLRGLLKHCNESPYNALLEAGEVTEADEAYMRKHGPRH